MSQKKFTCPGWSPKGSHSKYYDSLPNELVDALLSRKCILFAGSGVSTRCLGLGRKPLPKWDEFLSGYALWQLQNKKITEGLYSDLKALINQGKNLIVAQELIEISDSKDISDYLNNTFEPRNIVPSLLHEIVVSIPFSCILTSNYDNLFEQAFFNRYKNLPRVFTNVDIEKGALPSDQDFYILKLHGDINTPNSIVLSHKSYADILYNSPSYRELMERFFCEYTILFIGYGGNDPDIEAIYDKMISSRITGQRPHFMLAKKDKYNNVEKRRLERDKGIRLIEYVDYFGLHNHIDTFLCDLADRFIDKGGQLSSLLPITLRSQILVLFSEKDARDGIFLRDFLFRNGAITLTEEGNNGSYMLENFSECLENLQCLLLYFGKSMHDSDNHFFSIVDSAIEMCRKRCVHVIAVVLEGGTSLFAGKYPEMPRFRVPKDFTEAHLATLKSYLLGGITIYSSEHGIGEEAKGGGP
ncbi:MAG: SIR2 family protein [Verrucomicrobiota bacterium]